MRWICARCRFEYDDRPETCAGCLTPHSLVPLPVRVEGRDVATQPRRRVGVVRADAMKPDTRRFPYGPPWDSWALGWPHAALLVGPPGAGKSTLASAMAASAARQVEVLYLAVEEGHAVQLRDRLHRAGLTELAARRLSISDARTPTEVFDDLAGSKAQLVILDSSTASGLAPEAWTAAVAGRSWIATVHINSQQTVYGGQGWAHAADVVVFCKEGEAMPRKNRFGPMHSINIWSEVNHADE